MLAEQNQIITMASTQQGTAREFKRWDPPWPFLPLLGAVVCRESSLEGPASKSALDFGFAASAFEAFDSLEAFFGLAPVFGLLGAGLGSLGAGASVSDSSNPSLRLLRLLRLGQTAMC